MCIFCSQTAFNSKVISALGPNQSHGPAGGGGSNDELFDPLGVGRCRRLCLCSHACPELLLPSTAPTGDGWEGGM